MTDHLAVGMRRSRQSTKQRSAGGHGKLFFGSVAGAYQQNGLLSSLNKVYIRNFHEYHFRARSNDPVRTTAMRAESAA